MSYLNRENGYEPTGQVNSEPVIEPTIDVAGVTYPACTWAWPMTHETYERIRATGKGPEFVQQVSARMPQLIAEVLKEMGIKL